MKRVVITGMGALSPVGNDLTSTWEALKAGKSGANIITHFDADKFKTRFACELKNWKASDHFDRKEVRYYDPFTLYAIQASDEAINNAQVDFETLNRKRIGVIWGSGNGGMTTFDQQMKEYVQGDGTPRFNPFFIPRQIVDIASGVISIRHKLHGVNFTTISACASSTSAIIEATNYIRWNKADMIITGGSDAAITESGIGGFSGAKALSTRNEDYEKASRPFDVTRDGFVMGEGAAAMVLESYEHAVARGANIIAEVYGGGMAGDAYHLTGSSPEGDGACYGMELALEDANIHADDVDYLNMHATSTKVGDESELKAVNRLYGHRDSLVLGATKSMTGHLLGAAGALEGLIAVMATIEDIVPPTINTEELEEGAKPFNFNLGRYCSHQVNFAMSNTFGFGGHIATLVVGKPGLK